MDNPALHASLATLITTFTLKKLQLDNQHFSALYSIFLLISSACIPLLVKEVFNGWTIAIAIIAAFAIKYKETLGPIFNQHMKRIGITMGIHIEEESNNYRHLILHISEARNIYIDYIKFNPDYFQPCEEFRVGTINREKLDNMRTFYYYRENARVADDIKVPFVDTRFNKKGYYMWRSALVQRGIKPDSIELFYEWIEIFVEKQTCENIEEYYQNIEQFVKKHRETQNIELYYVQVFAQNVDIAYKMFAGTKRTAEELENKYLTNFYHPNKNDIWKQVKLLHYTPEEYFEQYNSYQLNFICDGPPGCGKSRMTHLLAQLTNRHVIDIDFIGLKTKINAHKMLRNPYCKTLDRHFKPNEVIFSLGEFDITIIKLYENEKKRRKQQQQYNISTQCIKMNEQEEEKEHEKTQDTSSNVSQDCELAVRDFLEIIQGPIPLQGAIIFGATNRLPYLKEICPELFRFGRFTTIQFPGPTTQLIQQIVQNNFGTNAQLSKECKQHIQQIFENNQTKTKTTLAEIVHQACFFKVENKTLKQFEQWLKTLN